MHTNGPWKVILDPTRERIHIRSGSYIVASLDNRRGLGEPEANARLIAEAPAMLEALEELCRVNELHDTVTNNEFIDAYNNAHMAIRKAKGD